jgi:hypothetical protein
MRSSSGRVACALVVKPVGNPQDKAIRDVDSGELLVPAVVVHVSEWALEAGSRFTHTEGVNDGISPRRETIRCYEVVRVDDEGIWVHCVD